MTVVGLRREVFYSASGVLTAAAATAVTVFGCLLIIMLPTVPLIWGYRPGVCIASDSAILVWILQYY